MRYRLVSLLILMLLVIPAGNRPGVSFAEPDQQPIVFHSATPLLPPAHATDTTPLAVMVELAAPPALVGTNDSAAITTRSLQNQAVQTQLESSLQAAGARILFRSTLAYNGIALAVPASRVAALRSLPGVVGVHAIAPLAAPDAATATAAVAAAATWNSPQNATGEGVRIGIIDTGVDYTHATFGGAGTTQAYTANNPAQIEQGTFPTAKVVGGYDFAGNGYDADGRVGSPIPAPDPDPLDCNGHGTHVAGVAAGYGVTARGARYAGAYTSPLQVGDFRVVPGVAPRAQVYALKIFGCAGTSTLLTQAIEWALDPNQDGNIADHLDVLSIAVSTPFGGSDDPDAVAVDNAVKAGITVITSAGDTPGTFYALGSPGSAARSITVGATSRPLATNINATQTLTGGVPISARGPQRGNAALKPDVLAPGNAIASALVGSGTAAATVNGAGAAVPQVAGAAALLRQLYGSWTPDQAKAALVQTAAPVMAESGTPPASLAGAGQIDLANLGQLDMLVYEPETRGGISFAAPALTSTTTLVRQMAIQNLADRERTMQLAASSTITESGVTIAVPALVTVPPLSTVAVSVSATINPAQLDFTPDSSVARVQDGQGRYYLAEQSGQVTVASTTGTRVRPGHVADLPPVAFYVDNQLITNSINTDNIGSYVALPNGTRTIRVFRANTGTTGTPIITKQATLLPDHDYTFILVGREKVFDIAIIDETPAAPPAPGTALLHFNNANVAVDANSGPFDVYLDDRLVTTALAASASTSYIAIPVGRHVVTFYPAGKKPSLQTLNAIETFDAQDGELLLVGSDRQGDDYYCDIKDLLCRANERGFIKRSPYASKQITSHIAFNIFPKSASASSARSTLVLSTTTPTFTLPLQNAGARNDGLADIPGPQTPLVSAFELEGTSPALPNLAAGARGADIQYVGVSNNISFTNIVSNQTIFFGTASYGTWSTPHEVEIRIYIDTNLDGVDDYVVLNSDYGAAYYGRPTDSFISPIYRIQPDGSLVAFDFSLLGSLSAPSIRNGVDLGAFNTAVMFQCVDVETLGLTAGQTRIRYHVETRARDVNNFGTVVDRVPANGSLDYDIAGGGLNAINTNGVLELRPLFVDANGGVVTGAASKSAAGRSMLLLHHHNVPGQQAQVVSTVQFAAAAPVLKPQAYLPVAMYNAP